MTWHIVTMQKQIPYVPNYGHNYVALVNDDGKIIEEYHGFHSVLSREGFTINHPVPGNFLIPIKGASGAVMGDERNVPLGTANTIPILRDGTYVNGIAQDIVSGDEASVRSVWNAGVNATDAALAGGKFLYVGTDVRPFIGKDGINSNSVWGTFLRSIGIADPGSHNGPLIIPGVDVDLRTAPSNNPLFGQPDQDQLYNRQQHGALDPSDGTGTRFGAIPGAPAAAAADVAGGDPIGIGDPAALLKPVGPAGGGSLTMAGVQQLMRFLDAGKTMEGRAQSAMEQNLLRAARGAIAGPDGPDGTAGREGETRFQNFLGAYFPALDQGLQSGKSAAELLTPGSPDYLGKLIPPFTPPPPQKSSLVLAAANGGIEATPLPPPPPSGDNNVPGTTGPDQGMPEPINVPSSG